MLLASFLAFFLVVFLMATLTAAIAWLEFLKRQSEARDAKQFAAAPVIDEQAPESSLLREGRLSTLNF
jgi:hypothetical protein